MPIQQYNSIKNKLKKKKITNPQKKIKINDIFVKNFSNYKAENNNTPLCIYRDDRLVLIPIRKPY
ncbi:hypothetical protein FN3523_1019 [Francisella hispaniensis]|uniref:Uncharacterized protein n=1 Tax=Francisella hispaniensis TaxID=622488 RepID=F4BFS8_9GAMM|nr:hypothetical protein FN3523_1019 [Francisella hispaniensis]